MIKSGNPALSSGFVLLLLLFLLRTASSGAQTVPVPSQNASSDVVVLSLEALDARVEHSRHARVGLLGNADPAAIRSLGTLQPHETPLVLISQPM